MDVTVTQPIAEGSIVVLTDVFEDDDDEQARLPEIVAELRRSAGHNQFTVVVLDEHGSVSVHGRDDLVEALRRIAAQALR